MKKWPPSAWLALLIIAAAAYLALTGLAHNYFWDDEAGTAIFARNLLDFGKLTGWDGRNLAAYGNGRELDDAFINRFFPPLQFFLAAASFRVLGVSTFSARLPFVLTGLAALPLFFMLLDEWTGRRRLWSICGLLLLSFSPSFLLFIRQCRYYSLVIFFPVAAYLFYRRYLKAGRIVDLAALAIALLGLFFSHYLICFAFAAALLSVHAAFHLRTRPPGPFLAAAGIFLAAAAGHLIFSGIILPDLPAPAGKEWLSSRLTLLGWNCREINSYGFFPWMMIFPLAWLLCDRRGDRFIRRAVREWLLLIAVFVVAVSLASPQPVLPRGDADVRYLLPLLPFCAGLLAAVVFSLRIPSKAAGGLVLVLLVSSNLFTLNPLYRLPLRFDLVSLIREIHRKHLTAYEAAVGFIREHCRQDDLLVVVPPNMADPLQFYAGDRVVFAGRLDRSTRLPLERVRELNPDLLVEESRPDWIVSFRLRPVIGELVEHYRTRGMDFELYEVLDVYFLGEAIRPEILLREFGERKDIPPEQKIFFFRRVAPDDPGGAD